MLLSQMLMLIFVMLPCTKALTNADLCDEHCHYHYWSDGNVNGIENFFFKASSIADLCDDQLLWSAFNFFSADADLFKVLTKSSIIPDLCDEQLLWTGA